MSSPSRYQFHELIAAGGMGEVWRATDTALGRDVAIKLLKPDYAEDPVSRQRFDSEARHAAALVHPHIAAVYDVGEMPTASGLMRPYLVMELVDGKPLSELIHPTSGPGRALDPAVVRDLLGQAGDALSLAHRAGIVHRDVKPANLLVTADGQVKVTDFGIARAATSLPITTTGQVMGTPQYLSPEQARGEQATPASDVYSLGVVAFECLTGHRPFDKETPVATAIAHLNEPVPPLPVTVPADIAAVVMKALAKDPANRYADAAAFTAALRGVGGARTDTPPAGIPVVVPPLVPAADATQVVPPTPEVDSPTGVLGTTTVVDRPDPQPSVIASEPGTEETRPWWKRVGVLNWFLIVLALIAVIAVLYAVWFLNHDAASDSTSTGVPSSPTASTSASGKPSKTPKPFDLPTDCYAGQQVSDVTGLLKAQGLKVKTQQVPQESGKFSDEVQYVTPCRGVTKGSVVTIKYFPGPSQAASPTTSAPASSKAPVTSAPASPTTSATTTVTPSPTATTTTPTTTPSPADTASPAARKDTTR